MRPEAEILTAAKEALNYRDVNDTMRRLAALQLEVLLDMRQAMTESGAGVRGGDYERPKYRTYRDNGE